MAIINYKGCCIKRDTNVCDYYQYYLSEGQGCGTIWFRSFTAAAYALKQDGVKTGQDLFDCTKCSCHYSNRDPEQKKYRFHSCKNAKRKYADKFI